MALAAVDDFFLEPRERPGKGLHLFIGLTQEMQH